jgi:hypothetical protein
MTKQRSAILISAFGPLRPLSTPGSAQADRNAIIPARMHVVLATVSARADLCHPSICASACI